MTGFVEDSQHPHGSLQLVVMPVPGGLVPSFGFCKHSLHMVYKHPHKVKISKSEKINLRKILAQKPLGIDLHVSTKVAAGLWLCVTKVSVLPDVIISHNPVLNCQSKTDLSKESLYCQGYCFIISQTFGPICLALLMWRIFIYMTLLPLHDELAQENWVENVDRQRGPGFMLCIKLVSYESLEPGHQPCNSENPGDWGRSNMNSRCIWAT